ASCAGHLEVVIRGGRPGPAAPLSCWTLRAPSSAGGTSRRGPASSHTGGVAVLAEPTGRTWAQCATNPISVHHPTGLKPKVRECPAYRQPPTADPAKRWGRRTQCDRDVRPRLPRTRVRHDRPPTTKAIGMRDATCHPEPVLSREISAIRLRVPAKRGRPGKLEMTGDQIPVIGDQISMMVHFLIGTWSLVAGVWSLR